VEANLKKIDKYAPALREQIALAQSYQMVKIMAQTHPSLQKRMEKIASIIMRLQAKLLKSKNHLSLPSINPLVFVLEHVYKLGVADGRKRKK
jgi:predicted patatin/cPLA2 family phospholipase